jgi:hypothetical protein
MESINYSVIRKSPTAQKCKDKFSNHNPTSVTMHHHNIRTEQPVFKQCYNAGCDKHSEYAKTMC